MPDHAANRDGRKQVATYAKLSAEVGSSGLVEVQPKLVWAAVLFALLFGPIGLLYCTIKGTIVMTIVSVVLTLLLGRASFLIIAPMCAFWVWRAARESTSLFD
jgi:hypothetical protein